MKFARDFKETLASQGASALIVFSDDILLPATGSTDRQSEFDLVSSSGKTGALTHFDFMFFVY